jgi:tRNA threonylcarbamoyladenosine biosynthesis protein TsaB
MIALFKTDSNITRLGVKLSLNNSDDIIWIEWESGRELAQNLLIKLDEFISKNNKDLSDITGIIIFRGPGSFTSLRIGCTVANTIAYSLGVPIVGEIDEKWAESGLERLKNNENDQIVMPLYGASPNITPPSR